MSTNAPSFLPKTSGGKSGQVIERLKGTGVAISQRGKEIPVQYHLSLIQEEIEAAPGEQPQMGSRSFAGQIWCPHDGSFVAVHLGQTMTLRMEDGRKLRFVHRNRDGGITVTKWLG